MLFFDILRYAVFAVFAFSGAVALGSWALRTRRISPFGTFGQLVRRSTDTVLAPIETWQLRRGGNPQHAPWWLLGGSVAGGIIVITAADWLSGFFARLGFAASSGPRGLVRLGVFYAVQFVLLALIIRVIGSWFGAGRVNRWVGWTYRLTDWIVEPLRRVIPPLGMIDITPIVAWFLLQFLLSLVLGLI